MTLHPYLFKTYKVASVVIAGAAALLASLLVGVYSVILFVRSLEGTTMGMVFGAIFLVVLAVLGYGFAKLSWAHRMWVGVALLACSFILMPRPSCAGDNQTTMGC